MEVECSNSRPPGPDSLTGEEEVNIVIFVIIMIMISIPIIVNIVILVVIMIMISIPTIIMITSTMNCVLTNMFAGSNGEVFREC